MLLMELNLILKEDYGYKQMENTLIQETLLVWGNNQMLYGDPKTGEIKRFLVGPNEAEVTGLTWSKDYKTMFCWYSTSR